MCGIPVQQGHFQYLSQAVGVSGSQYPESDLQPQWRRLSLLWLRILQPGLPSLTLSVSISPETTVVVDFSKAEK